MLGFSYSTYTVVLWGALPYMVEAKVLGTAFGICTVFSNLGMAVAPPIVGKIYDGTTKQVLSNEFFYFELFFVVISVFAFISFLGAYYIDKKYRNNIL